MELNFEGLETQKWNLLMDTTQEKIKQRGHLFSYHVYFLGHGQIFLVLSSSALFWFISFLHLEGLKFNSMGFSFYIMF